MSKHKISFNVDVRERVGTGGAREARRQGFVPGVLYGGGDGYRIIARAGTHHAACIDAFGGRQNFLWCIYYWCYQPLH